MEPTKSILMSGSAVLTYREVNLWFDAQIRKMRRIRRWRRRRDDDPAPHMLRSVSPVVATTGPSGIRGALLSNIRSALRDLRNDLLRRGLIQRTAPIPNAVAKMRLKR